MEVWSQSGSIRRADHGRHGDAAGDPSHRPRAQRADDRRKRRIIISPLRSVRAHERGLGVGDPRDIEVVGLDISNINFGFTRDEDTFASWGQKKIYWGPLHFLEKPLLRSPIVPWSYAASNIYYNLFWYPMIGRGRVSAAKNTEWGKLFQSY